jgi:L-ascorbate oxidase
VKYCSMSVSSVAVRSATTWIPLLLAVFLGLGRFAFAQSELREPTPFGADSSGDVSLTILAGEVSDAVDFGDGYKAKPWAYHICKGSSQSQTCPDGMPSSTDFAGSLLMLRKDSHFKVTLVNLLPPSESADPSLISNPTNLHTHGLLVSATPPAPGESAYSDYIFVLGYPRGKMPPKNHAMSHGASVPNAVKLEVTDDPIKYDILIPKKHPSGLFWFHPHVHGLAESQVAKGLSGMITIGDLGDYVCDRPLCLAFGSKPKVRHIALRDSQLVPNSLAGVQPSYSISPTPDAQQCNPDIQPGEQRNGYCPFTLKHGRWFFTLNGQVFPKLTIDGASGEIWRILNASPTMTYDLSLDDASGKQTLVQILSMDGVSFDIPSPTSTAQLQDVFGSRLKAESCLGLTPASNPTQTKPICAYHIKMMPSSRVELWISYRDSNGIVVAPPTAGANLILHNARVDTGGDSWPSVNLAMISFASGQTQTKNALGSLGVTGEAQSLSQTGGIFSSPVLMPVPSVNKLIAVETVQQLRKKKLSQSDMGLASSVGDAASAEQLKKVSPAALRSLGNLLSPTSSLSCKALPRGQRRRIYFGVPPSDPTGSFALAYEIVDDHGNLAPGSPLAQMEKFSDKLRICLPLGDGNTAVTETWELVNVANEDHNFHIHQTKFSLVPDEAPDPSLPIGGVLYDNVPLLHAPNCDGSLDSFKKGSCKAKPLAVKIRFSQIGTFVYHCHILEHEDGGMMAAIEVVAHN